MAAENPFTRRDGGQKLLSLIDDMRARPTWRQGDLPLPTLLIRGEANDVADAAAALRSRRNPQPRAFVTVYAAAETQPRHEVFADVLRHAAEQLASAAPRGEAKIRFPLLYHVIWLLGLDLPEKRTEIDAYVKRAVTSRSRRISLTTDDQGPQSVRANVRAYIEGPLTAWFAFASLFNVAWFLAWNVSLLPIFLSIAISVVGIIAHIWVVSRSWAGNLRYRWFSRQPYAWSEHEKLGDRPTDAISFAIRVIRLRYTIGDPGNKPDSHTATRHARDRESANAQLELLLVNAFLEDLRQAYDRSLWKIWRRVTWTRTIYPMLLVDGKCAPLAERFEQVRTQTATSDPLFLVAMPTEGDELSGLHPNQVLPDVVRPEDVDRVWRAWRVRLEQDRRVGSRRTLLVDVDGDHARLLQADGSIPRPARRKPFLSQLWVPVVLVTALAVGPAVYVVAAQFGKCQFGIKRVETGECVGVGVNGFVFDDRLRSVTGRIEANNRKVMESGSPYGTVYHLGAFSVPRSLAAGAGDLLADAHGELAGAALLQEFLIDNSKDPTIPLLRILPVNAGSEYHYAPEAADAMLDQLDSHRNVVGVIGANESRESVRQALKKLSVRAVPVITTTATYDDLSRIGGNNIPTVFPLAPSNTELARHAAHWAKEGVKDLRDPAKRFVLGPAKSVAVLADATSDDLYASDLGARFKAAFGEGAEEFPFSGADGIQPIINKICRDATSMPDLIYYAGRSSQFGEFYNAASNACPGITVLAGDAVTEYVNDRASRLIDARIKIFYTPLASEDSWTDVLDRHKKTFYQDFKNLLDELKLNEDRQQPSSAYAAMAFDAANALMQAVKDAYRAQRAGDSDTHEINRAGVTLALERLSPIYGASGLIHLHAGKDNHQPRDRPVMLISITVPTGERQTKQEVVAQCGELYLGQSRDRDQSQRENCPPPE